MASSVSRDPSYQPLFLVLALFVGVIAFINPLREMAIMDDWAYALTVRHLIETGTYRLHDWAAANMPFQVYWGALFGIVFGFSNAVLRVSTLVLVGIGIVAFYFLVKEHGLGSTQAGVLTLVLVASPLVLDLSFTFMTDVPFMACVIIALYLYTRAIRQRSIVLMFLASIGAAAAILIRQFGVAFVPGLFLLWVVSQQRRETLLLFVTGVFLPAVAATWQFYMGAISANWTNQWLVQQQVAFLTSTQVVVETPWRLMVILQYMALFGLPLTLPSLLNYIHGIRIVQAQGSHTPVYRREVLLLFGIVGFLFVVSFVGTLALNRRGILPLIPWNLDVIGTWPSVLSAALTLCTVAGAFLFSRLFFLRYLGIDSLDRLTQSDLVVDFVTFFLLLFQIIFLQFGDEYLLALIPYALIVVGRAVLRRADWGIIRLTTLTALGVLIIAALWIRGILELAEAQWTASERLYASGIPMEEISTSWEWASFHGAFDDYLAGLNDPAQGSVGGFFAMLDERRYVASYLVLPLSAPPVGDVSLKVIETVPYRDALLYNQCIYVIERTLQK